MNRGDRGHPYPGSFLCPDTGEEPPFELVLLKNTNPRKFGMGALISGAAAAVGAQRGSRWVGGERRCHPSSPSLSPTLGFYPDLG